MTSKISYSKMVKHSMGQRVWYAALLGLAFFLCFPLMAMLQFSGNVHTVASVQVTNATEILQEMKDSLRAFLAGGNPFAALTVAGALCWRPGQGFLICIPPENWIWFTAFR